MLTLLQPEIEEYARSKTDSHGTLLEALEQETYATMPLPQMVSGQLSGRFLKMMVQLTGAKRILEVGMFTGYSALSMAEGLPSDGELITTEIDPKSISLAKKYFERSEHGKKIVIKEGPALESIKELKGFFDLVFIDADKVNYSNYYEAVLPLVKSGGVILVDNVLWSGRVVNPKHVDDNAIVALNNLVSKDNRVEKVLATIRDGIYIIRKK